MVKRKMKWHNSKYWGRDVLNIRDEWEWMKKQDAWIDKFELEQKRSKARKLGKRKH